MLKAKSNNSVFTCIAASNHSLEEREVNDYYATEPKATSLLLDEFSFSNNVWECACGEGHISKVLEAYGYNVKSTDLIDRGYGLGGVDFLKTDEKFDGDIITNPPYKYAQAFTEKALETISDGHRVAMFLKLTFLEGKARAKMFAENPPEFIYVASARLNCAKNGNFDEYKGSAVAYGWFIWRKGFKGEPKVRWFNNDVN